MYEYHYVALKLEGGFVTIRLEDHRAVIRSCAEEGWRYVGYVPTLMTATGVTSEVDLIFEREIK